jgi:hypothetical protein
MGPVTRPVCACGAAIAHAAINTPRAIFLTVFSRRVQKDPPSAVNL